MADEPEFVRLWIRNLNLWVKNYGFAEGGPGVAMSTAAQIQDAGVFLSPPAADLERLQGALFKIEIKNATFAEWVEAGGKEPNQ